MAKALKLTLPDGSHVRVPIPEDKQGQEYLFAFLHHDEPFDGEWYGIGPEKGAKRFVRLSAVVAAEVVEVRERTGKMVAL